jgi:PAS domain S-box-containing protein
VSAGAVPPVDRAARMHELARRLIETEAELHALADGGIDAIIDPDTSTPLLLRDAQHALRDAESRSRELIASLPIIACELGADGTTRFVNRAVEEILGYAPDDLIGRHWWHAIGVRAPSGPVARMLDEPLQDYEQRVRARNGEDRLIAWTSRVVSAAGGPATIQLFGVDLTERRRATEAELKFTREHAARTAAEAAERRAALLSEAGRLLNTALRYEATLTSIAHLAVSEYAEYCIVDLLEPDGTLRRVDVAHPDLTRFDPLREFLADASPDSCGLRVVREVVRTGEPRFVPDVTEQRMHELADDTVAPRLIGRSFACVPLTARGETIGALTVVSNEGGPPYTPADFALFGELARRAAMAVDNARLFEAALTASQAKSDFLAVMSHELRTPLNAILGYAELMLLGVPARLPAESLEQVERVQLAARHLLQMIDEILTLSRVEAGEESLTAEPYEFCNFLYETVALIEPQARSKKLDLRCETSHDELHVVMDGRKVRQILLNLLSNAVKFTAEGSVAMRAWAEGRDIVVTVQDTGDGIADEHIERIFDQFWQVERGHSRRKDGVGLGLHVARRLAHLMAGDITVRSVPGDGTQFELRLPGIVQDDV